MTHWHLLWLSVWAGGPDVSTGSTHGIGECSANSFQQGAGSFTPAADGPSLGLCYVCAGSSCPVPESLKSAWHQDSACSPAPVCLSSAHVSRQLWDPSEASTGPQIGAAPAMNARTRTTHLGERRQQERGKTTSQVFWGMLLDSCPGDSTLHSGQGMSPSSPGEPGSRNVKVTPGPGKQWLQIGAIWAGCGRCVRSVSQTAGWKGSREAI